MSCTSLKLQMVAGILLAVEKSLGGENGMQTIADNINCGKDAGNWYQNEYMVQFCFIQCEKRWKNKSRIRGAVVQHYLCFILVTQFCQYESVLFIGVVHVPAGKTLSLVQGELYIILKLYKLFVLSGLTSISWYRVWYRRVARCWCHDVVVDGGWWAPPSDRGGSSQHPSRCWAELSWQLSREDLKGTPCRSHPGPQEERRGCVVAGLALIRTGGPPPSDVLLSARRSA